MYFTYNKILYKLFKYEKDFQEQMICIEKYYKINIV